jgi:hypothetical protein
MSELSMNELQAETVELLPERETLGVITIVNGGSAAIQEYTFFSANKSVNVQDVEVAVGSFNSYHSFNG